MESCIRGVRQAVGDSGQQQRIIQTRYGQGYSLVAEVRCMPTRREPSPVETLPPESWRTPQTNIVPMVGEYKLVTVLCCGLARSDNAPLSLDLQHRRIQRLFDLAAYSIRRYDGYLQPMTGTSLGIVFGYPATQEDHAQRAILAALTLRQ